MQLLSGRGSEAKDREWPKDNKDRLWATPWHECVLSALDLCYQCSGHCACEWGEGPIGACFDSGRWNASSGEELGRSRNES